MTKSKQIARRGMNKALMARMGSKQRYCDCTSSPAKERDGFAPATPLAAPQLDLSAARIAAYHIRDCDPTEREGSSMNIRDFLHRLHAKKPSRRSGLRPHLEPLEDRRMLSVNVINSFPGLSSRDDPRYQPPDTDAAAGPDFIVETVNATVEFIEKHTRAPLFVQRLEDFFAPLGQGSYVFDPVVTYDEMAGRFFVGALDGNSCLDFAVSDTSNPLDGFSEMHRVDLFEADPQGQPLFSDYPKLGFNADAYVLTEIG